jgi:hypothetical protein
LLNLQRKNCTRQLTPLLDLLSNLLAIESRPEASGNSPCKKLPARFDEERCGAHMSKLSASCRFFTLRWGGTLAIGLFVAFLAAIAVPNRPGSRTSKTHAIESNLRQLDGAVQMWGFEHQKTGAVAVTLEDVAPYLRADRDVHGGMKSVAGEVYVLKTLTQPPEAVLTRKLGDRPKGTVLRLGTNGDVQFVFPKH